MTPRCCLVMALAAASAPIALAQEHVQFNWSWSEVIANTTAPVASPNGILEPGEAARLRLGVTISPGIGTPSSHLGMNGTIAGLSNVFFDLIGNGAADGSWSHIQRHGGWSGLNGTPAANGRNLMANGVFQFPPPGTVANSTNPVPELWSAVWTPATYHGPWVYTGFTAQRAEAAGPGSTGAQLLLNVGGIGPSLYASKPIDVTFGSIIIAVPSPGAGAMLLGVGLLAARRRR
jgi:hypothetical protein